MKRVKQFYYQLPKVARGFVDICFIILVLVCVSKLISPLLLIIAEWIYKFCKAAMLFVFPNMSHDVKIIFLAIGLFSMPLFIMLFLSVLSKKIGETQKESIQA